MFNTGIKRGMWRTAAGAALLIACTLVAACGGAGGTTTSKQPLAPTKPLGTTYVTTPTHETWTAAYGLQPFSTLAFATSQPNIGYASALQDKADQGIYTTTDRGNTWTEVGVLHSMPTDILAVDPTDAQDIVALSVYAPAPGTYTFQRSFDGGKTWKDQTTSLSVTGEVSRTGWDGSDFLIGFQLDQRLQGASAVVAFPRQSASVHLDTDGKINGATITNLTLLTGRNGKIQVWGYSGSGSSQTIYGVATTNLGKSWQTQPSTLQGKPSIAFAASADGATLFAVSSDNTQIGISSDGGATWATQALIATRFQFLTRTSFVIASNQALVTQGADATYIWHSGVWQKATSREINYASDGGSQHMARLWTPGWGEQNTLIVYFDD